MCVGSSQPPARAENTRIRWATCSAATPAPADGGSRLASPLDSFPLETVTHRGGRGAKFLLLVFGGRDVIEQGDRVTRRRAVAKAQNRQPSHCPVGIIVRKRVEHRSLGVYDPGMISRQQFERKERRPAAGRALVLQSSSEKIGLLREAQLADRTIGDGPIPIVRAANGELKLLVDLATEIGERPLVFNLGRTEGGFGEIQCHEGG